MNNKITFTPIKSLLLYSFVAFVTFSSFNLISQDIVITVQVECFQEGKEIDRFTVIVLQEKDTFSTTEVYNKKIKFFLPANKGIYSIYVKTTDYYKPLKKTIDSDALKASTDFEYKYYYPKFLIEKLETKRLILFENNSYKLKSAEKMKLDLLITDFHTDSVFSNYSLLIAGNQDVDEKEGISLKRAQSVKNYLEKIGLSPENLKIVDKKSTALRFPPEELIKLNSEEDIINLKKYNRRVHFIFSNK